MNKKIIGTISLCAILSTALLPYSSFAASSTSTAVSSPVVNSGSIKDYAKKLEPFVHKKADGTIYLDSSYKKHVNVPSNVINSITGWMNGLNQDVKAGLATISSDLKVSYKTQRTQRTMYTSSTSGINDYYIYWWGFEIYLDHATTGQIAVALSKGAIGSKLVEIISKKIPSAPTKVISALAEVATWILGSGAAALKIQDQGKGVILTIYWPEVFGGIRAQ
jgi:hypothetical protein